MKKRIIMFFCLMIAIISCTGCGLKNNSAKTDNKNTNKNSGELISKIDVKNSLGLIDNISVLTSSGDFYTIDAEEKKLQKDDNIPFKSSKMYAYNYYLTLDNELYVDYDEYFKYISTDKYEQKYNKIFSNVKKFDTNGFGCLLLIDYNDNAYAYNLLGDIPSKNKNLCGFEREYDLEKIFDNVNDVVVGFNFNGYVDKANNLYIKLSTWDEYKKEIENVKKVVYPYILTNSGELYQFNYYPDLKDTEAEINEVTKNVTDVFEDNGRVLYSRDNKLFIPNSGISSSFISEDKSQGHREHYVNVDTANNIKTLLYVGHYTNSSTASKLVYVDNNNIVHYYDGKEIKTSKYNMDTFKSMIEFVNGE